MTQLSPPSRPLLFILVTLSLSTPTTVASSFLLHSATTKGSRGATLAIDFVIGIKKSALSYNQILLTAGGADDFQHDGISSGGISPSSKPPESSTSSSPSSLSSSEAGKDYSKILSSTTTSSSPSSLLGPNAHLPPGFLRSRFPNFPWKRIPDLLTYLRCFAIPLFVGLFYLPTSAGRNNLYTGTTFAIASATDWLDGYLARRWDISTPFGAFLDPVADKLMVSTSLILLSGRYGSIVAIPTTIILAREIAVSALREWMAQRGERNVVKVGVQGKIKTALTMFALTILLFVPSSSRSGILFTIGIPLLYFSAFVTVTSGSVYFIAAAPALLGSKK